MGSARQQGLFKRLASRLLKWRRPTPVSDLPAGVALIQGMGWLQFELLVAEGFRQRGYGVSETGGGGGRSVDMVLTRGREQFLVDCKPWRAQAVGVAPLRELQGLVAARAAAGGFVLSSGVFTAEAQRFSEGCNIQLIDGSRLRDLLHARDEKTLPVVIRREGPFLDTTLPLSAWQLRSQPCPLCGGTMVERARGGRWVLACSHQPLCKGARELVLDEG